MTSKMRDQTGPAQTQPTDGRREYRDRTGIPPTEVGGLFRCGLQTKAERCFPEYHPREWVDRSGAAYNRGGPTLRFWLSLSPRAARGEAKREPRVRPYVGCT